MYERMTDVITTLPEYCPTESEKDSLGSIDGTPPNAILSTMMPPKRLFEFSLFNLPVWKYDDFLLEYLDQGFFGTVYKATHCDTKEIFVIKALRDDDDENRAMFMDEIHLLCKLSHPNVITCKGILFVNGSICYLSEFIEGGTLQELLLRRENLQLSWVTYLNITLDVARGMAYLHMQGVIHRDLNSKNVLLREVTTSHYKAIIIDLGLSYQKPDIVTPEEEIPSGPVGSPYHIAPELFNNDPCSQQADVFSYGIILCEMISGCPGADPEELPRTEDFGLNVEEFSGMASDCPAEFLNLAVRCCQVNPKLRPKFADIAKIIDIILDRYEHRNLIENMTGEHVSETFVEHDENYVDRVHFDDDYLIESSLLCSCGKTTKERTHKISDCVNIRAKYDRFGEVYRTASRRLMRKYVRRCSMCGGRILIDIEVKNGDRFKCHGDNAEVEILNDVNQNNLRYNVVKSDVINTLHSSNSSTPPDNNVDDCNTTERLQMSCPTLTKRIEIHMNTTQEQLAPLESPIYSSLERSSKFPAGVLLKQNIEDISSRTSQLAQNTPGRLPRFFSQIIRRRKNRITLANIEESRPKRGSRLSLQKIFHLSSHTLSHTLSPRDAVHKRLNGDSVVQRFTYSKSKNQENDYDNRRLSMPISVRGYQSGPNSPEDPVPRSVSPGAFSLWDDGCTATKNASRNTHHTLQTSLSASPTNSKSHNLSVTPGKHKRSRSLLDLLLRKKASF